MFGKIYKLDFLIALYIFAIVAAELLGAKTFPLFTLFGQPYSASVTIFLVALLFTINDVVIEVYGKERARSLVTSGLVIIGLLLIYTLISISLPPSQRFASSEAAYDEVFGRSARIAAASLIAFAVSLFLDVQFFARLRQKLGKQSLWLRSNLSNFGAQFFDTVIFMTLAFYALDRPFTDNLQFLVGLILPYWIIKCTISMVNTPFVYLGVKWLKSEKRTK